MCQEHILVGVFGKWIGLIIYWWMSLVSGFPGWSHEDSVVPALSRHSVDWLVSSGWSHMDPDVPEMSIHRMRIKMVVKSGCSGWSHEDPVVPALSRHSVDWLVSSGWSHMDPDVPEMSIHRMRIKMVVKSGCSGWSHEDPVVPALSRHSVDWLVSSGWSHMDPDVPEMSIHRMHIKMVVQDGCSGCFHCHEDPVVPEMSHHSVSWLVSSDWYHVDPDVPDLVNPTFTFSGSCRASDQVILDQSLLLVVPAGPEVVLHWWEPSSDQVIDQSLLLVILPAGGVCIQLSRNSFVWID
jgi:hypothetical protein